MAILGMAFPAFAQDAPAETSPASTEGARIWIKAASSEPNRRVFLHIRHKESVVQDEAVVFDCEVHASADLGLVFIHLMVTDASGVEVHRATEEARIPKGLTTVRFEWNVGQLPEGQFEARFELAQSRGRPLTWSEVALRKLASGTVEENLHAAGEALAKLLTQVSSLNEGTPGSPYLEARTAVAELFFELAGGFGDNWPRTQDVSRYVRRTADSVRALLTLELYPNDSEDWQDLLDPAKTRASAGGFRSADKPVFLIGIGDSNLQPGDLETMGRLHLNLGVIDGALPPADEAETALAEEWDPLFRTASDQHLNLMYLAAIPDPRLALEAL
ncbi:MAG: hypothetical protein IIA44_09355, partial [Acidobacteria bacterium]|nr:hypothetical protein [Acidobacteriota bacterium]